MLALWLFIRLAAERWWGGTVIMFGPRWPWGIPIVLWLATELLFRRHIRLPVVFAIIVWLFPVMGLCIPWHRALSFSRPAPDIRIITCNFHGNTVNDQAFANFVAETRPDLVVMEECFGHHPLFPLNSRSAFVVSDEEIRIESRWPIRRVEEVLNTHIACAGIAVEYQVLTPDGAVPLMALHFASPHDALSDAVRLRPGSADRLELNSDIRREQAAQVAATLCLVGSEAIVAGDFNLPTDSPIYRDDFAQLSDAFAAGGFGFGWSYRAHWVTSRIDHVLFGNGWRCDRSWVSPDVGSPHRAVVADLWKGL